MTATEGLPPADLPPVEIPMGGETVERGRSRLSALARFAAAFAVGALLVALLAVGAVYAFEQQYAARVLPGVRVGTTELGGLTRGQAAAALDRDYGALGSGRIIVAGPDGDVVIPYAAVSRRLDTDPLVAEALATGRPGAPIDRALAEIRTMLRGTTIAPRVVFDAQELTSRIAALTTALDRAPVDATARLSGNAFTVTPSAAGRSVDGTAAIAELTTSLAALDTAAEVRVELVPTTIPPAVDDADAAVAIGGAERMGQDVVLQAGEESWTITAATVRKWVRFSVSPDGRLVPTIDRAAALAAVKPLAKKTDRPAVDATFLTGKGGNGIIGVKPGVNGRALDAQATTDLVVAAVSARVAPDAGAPSVTPVLASTKPAITTEQATAIAPAMTMVSSWTTWYPIYINNGFGANIEIPTRAIDGTVIPAGGVFDFWQVVGPVSRAAGYRQGGAIIDGRTEPQGALAGGICSTSTTIFNAALRAGLKMGARLNHYYYIPRYPLGLDATVFISASGSAQTMTFTNDTAYPILVRGKITHSGGKGYVRFEIWTVPTGRTVSFSEPTVKNRHAASTVTELTPMLPAGQRKQVEYPVEGKDVWVTRVVRDPSGNVIHQETYYSHYATITGIIQVGTGGATASATPTPSPSPTPAPTPAPTPTSEPSPTPQPSTNP